MQFFTFTIKLGCFSDTMNDLLDLPQTSSFKMELYNYILRDWFKITSSLNGRLHYGIDNTTVRSKIQLTDDNSKLIITVASSVDFNKHVAFVSHNGCICVTTLLNCIKTFINDILFHKGNNEPLSLGKITLSNGTKYLCCAKQIICYEHKITSNNHTFVIEPFDYTNDKCCLDSLVAHKLLKLKTNYAKELMKANQHTSHYIYYNKLLDELNFRIKLHKIKQLERFVMHIKEINGKC